MPKAAPQSATANTINAVKLWSMLIPIRFGDMDAMGHVNNAEYMRYFEEARVAWSQHHGLRQHRTEGGFIIAKATIEYHKPLVYPGKVVSEIYSQHIGNTSFGVRQTLTLETTGEPAASADYVVVWFDYVNSTPAPVPERLRAILKGDG